VLHFVDSLRVGGKERQAVELLKGLCRIKHVQLMVVTMGEEQFYVPDIQRLGIPLVYLIRKLRWDPLIFSRLSGILKGFQPHILHTNSDMATFYALPLAKLRGIKLVNGTIRNAFSHRGFRWETEKLLLRLSDARVANSNAGLESRGFRQADRGNYVVYNGFDMGRFDSARTRGGSELNWGLAGKKAVGMIAEFSDFKDYPTYIQAARMILKKRQDVVFFAVGGGKNLEACKQLGASAGDGIRFLGERKDIEAIVSGLDLGVLCTYTEGISNAVMEYMAAEKPVVVTDGGGSREIVVEGENGFLIPQSNPEVLAQRIELLLDDPARAHRMGHAGKLHLQRHFSLDQLVANTMQMYQEVLAGRGNQASSTGTSGSTIGQFNPEVRSN
jgi:glycosyltransferase involved in cell wall biosynthesis